MVRTTIKNASIIQKKTVQEAKQIFIQHCRIKNLSPRTLKYYEEDLEYFFSHVQVKYVEQITLLTKVLSINSIALHKIKLHTKPKRGGAFAPPRSVYSYVLLFFSAAGNQRHDSYDVAVTGDIISVASDAVDKDGGTINIRWNLCQREDLTQRFPGFLHAPVTFSIDCWHVFFNYAKHLDSYHGMYLT